MSKLNASNLSMGVLRQTNKSSSVLIQLNKQMLMANFYSRLNVPQTASQLQIKKSYFDIIRQVHPDKFQDNIELRTLITQRLNEAYYCLSDHNRRADYDLELNYGESKQGCLYESDNELGDPLDDLSTPGEIDLRMPSFHEIFRFLDGFDEFKDDIFTLYHLVDSNISKLKKLNLRPGFDNLLRSFLYLYDIDFNDILVRNETSVIYDSALIDLSLQPKSCGFLTRRVYLAMPLTFPIRDERLMRLKYGQEWLHCFSFLNYSNRKVMQYRSPNHSKFLDFFLALNNYQN